MTRSSIQEIMEDFPQLATLADTENLLLVNLARDGVLIEDEIRNSRVVQALLNNIIADQLNALDDLCGIDGAPPADATDQVVMRDIQTRLIRAKQMGLFLMGCIEQARLDHDEAKDALNEGREDQGPVVHDIRRPPKDQNMDEG
jgi:hypothetical protein